MINIEFVQIILLDVHDHHKSQTKISHNWENFTNTLKISSIGTKHTKDNKISTSQSNSRLEATNAMVGESKAIFINRG